jgi:hypothetical protein
MSWLNTLIPNCRQATRFQSEAMDKELPLAKRIGLKLHLLFCDLCRRYGKQIRFLQRAAHEHADEVTDNTPGLPVAAKARIKERMKSV